MSESEPVNRVPLPLGDGVEMYVEVSSSVFQDGEREISGRRASLEQFTDALTRFSTTLTDSLKKSGASRFSVEFGCEVAAETGRLVAVLGKGSATSSVKVTLEWEDASS
ncbi:CU044_2847 family protein [Streptosporangium sp. CA-135522]|uniref:CU044_2847 family protein n=1 Tax=Streptosporangium sp. CA-135522 TaxID=3240072 RepID=UPI003D8C58A9